MYGITVRTTVPEQCHGLLLFPTEKGIEHSADTEATPRPHGHTRREDEITFFSGIIRSPPTSEVTSVEVCAPAQPSAGNSAPALGWPLPCIAPGRRLNSRNRGPAESERDPTIYYGSSDSA